MALKQTIKTGASWLIITTLPIAMFGCWMKTRPSEEAAQSSAGMFSPDAQSPKAANPSPN